MSLGTDFKNLMNQVVTIEPRIGNDGMDDFFGEGGEHGCYVQERVKVIRDIGNNEIVSMTQIFLDIKAPVFYASSPVTWEGKPVTYEELAVGMFDRVTFWGRVWPIKQISTPVDAKGRYGVILYL
jgi:hypothetical protein